MIGDGILRLWAPCPGRAKERNFTVRVCQFWRYGFNIPQTGRNIVTDRINDFRPFENDHLFFLTADDCARPEKADKKYNEKYKSERCHADGNQLGIHNQERIHAVQWPGSDSIRGGSSLRQSLIRFGQRE